MRRQTTATSGGNDDRSRERLLLAAGMSDEVWTSMTEHLTPRIRSVARAHRLAAHDAEDVVQTTWLRLLEHREQIRDPGALEAWLHTTARRESLRVLREGARAEPVDPQQLTGRSTSQLGVA